MLGIYPQANFSDDAAGILMPSNMSIVIGHQHIKALFEEYTDATFTTKKVHMAPLPIFSLHMSQLQCNSPSQCSNP